MLILIGTSVSCYTFHSHTSWGESNTANQQAHHGEQLKIDSSLCPVCGYLFGANVAPHIDSTSFVQVISLLAPAIQQVYLAPFTSDLTGRSPPFIG